MATDELEKNSDPDWDSFIERLESIKSEEADESDIQLPDDGSIRSILKQRHSHRSIIFWFSLSVTVISFLFYIAIVAIQSWIRIKHDPTFTLFDGHELEILAVSVFGQSIGVVALITKSLWDDSPYKEVLVDSWKNK